MDEAFNITPPSAIVRREIPDDIRRAAEAITRAWAPPADHYEAIEAIETAILAERERATQAERDALVQRFRSMKYTADQGMDLEMECFNDGIEACVTAAAIRTPSTGEESEPLEYGDEQDPAGRIRAALKP